MAEIGNMTMENDLISRSALLDGLQDNSFIMTCIRSIINSAPVVDAVEVVRCKKCIKRGKAECPMFIDFEHFGYGYADFTADDGYCDRGEQEV